MRRGKGKRKGEGVAAPYKAQRQNSPPRQLEPSAASDSDDDDDGSEWATTCA